MNEFYAVFIGLLIRVGIPILVTGGLVYILHRLDVRWQREEMMHQQGKKPETGQKLCWEQKNCPAAQMATCPALNSDQPCWQVFRESNGYLAQKCLKCEVFRSAPVPTYSYTKLN
jgi:hypothetical protein